MAAAKQTLRFYQNNRVSTEVNDSLTHSVFRHAGGLLAQHTSGAEEGHLLMGVSNTDTVMTELGHAGKKQYPYTPYGRRPAQSGSNNPLAFNGEPLDAATGCYALGNGYRLYSPTLKRFCSPDNLSPFEKGGLNAYMYCMGDPVNHVDPTGHFGFSKIWVGLQYTAVAGVLVGTGLMIAGGFKKSKTLETTGVAITLIAMGIIGVAIHIQRRTLTMNSAPTASGPRLSLNSSPIFPHRGPPPAYDPPPTYDSPPTYDDAVKAFQPASTSTPGGKNFTAVSIELQAIRDPRPSYTD